MAECMSTRIEKFPVNHNTTICQKKVAENVEQSERVYAYCFGSVLEVGNNDNFS